MFVKELCWKCYAGDGILVEHGKREDFEEIWAEKRIWCPIASFDGRKYKPLERFKGIDEEEDNPTIIGSNLRFKDKVPENCPYIGTYS